MKDTKDTKDPKAAAKSKDAPKTPKERRFKAQVYVSLKPTVNDPEGNTIAGALGSLGFEGVEAVRAGRFFELRLRAKDAKRAGKAVDAMCARLLANPVIEAYRYDVKEV